MADSKAVKTPKINFIGQLETINDQLEVIRMCIEDPVAQGYLFTAQGMITTYLSTTSIKVLPTNATTTTKKLP